MADVASLIDVLEERAQRHPDKAAFVFLADGGGVEASLTFAELLGRARAVAAELAGRGGRPGDRALLAFRPGLDVVAGFLGCLAAGIVAVPVAPPRRAGKRGSSAAILADCRPRFGLTGAGPNALRDGIESQPEEGPLDWLTVANAASSVAPPSGRLHRPARSDLALLQYTSGSTAQPKGVMVTHANLLANLEMIRLALGNSETSTHVSWMPLHHDMGLILNVLQALYVGATCVLMAPVSFLQRPLSFLKAIHDFGAECAGGPNFGFDLCVARFRPEAMEGIDLAGWRIACNGAEPVRAETLRRFAATFAPYGFSPSVFYPCYGMAEATLLISGGRRGDGSRERLLGRAAMQGLRVEPPAGEADAQAVIGCGRALEGEEIAIVDPEMTERLGHDRIGEIWVRGPHVAGGYWGKEEASHEGFAAQISGEAGVSWLRTGDLGFLDAQGELFVTGRRKDLIIIRGINHYPQDIEHTVQAADARLRPGFGAAFPVTGADGQERVVIVQEAERSRRHGLDIEEVIGNIREAVSEEHGLSLHDVVLVRPGSIPKTTSGKIQRRLTRKLWQDEGLDRLDGG